MMVVTGNTLVGVRPRNSAGPTKINLPVKILLAAHGENVRQRAAGIFLILMQLLVRHILVLMVNLVHGEYPHGEVSVLSRRVGITEIRLPVKMVIAVGTVVIVWSTIVEILEVRIPVIVLTIQQI